MQCDNGSFLNPFPYEDNPMNSKRHRTALSAAFTAVGLSLSLTTPAFAASKGADFYKGKTVTYIVATAPGGNYDTYGRLVADFMQKHLPGSTFVVRNMPGAGHLIGANTIYASKPDGLTIGTFNTGLIYNQMTGREGVKFDLAKMSWIGKAASDPRVIMVAANSPIKSFDDLRKSKTQVNFGASGVGSASFVESTVLIDALDLPVKLISGFNGNEGEMAMRRNELTGIIGSRSSFEPFVKNGYGRFIAQMGGKDKDVPQLSRLVTDPNGKSLIALIESQGEIARLTAGPPGIPKERLDALRTAYKNAMEDKELQARMQKIGIPHDPAYGDDVLKSVKAALDQPPETVALLGKTLNIKDPTLKAEGPLLEVDAKGKKIVFAGHDGQKVESKPSGSRTQITIAGKEATRGDLKTGMNCEINYKSGGDNEPTTIVCK
jgi:tripartite-type tricarboxylate transporter receptor subunit TctC